MTIRVSLLGCLFVYVPRALNRKLEEIAERYAQSTPSGLNKLDCCRSCCTEYTKGA